MLALRHATRLTVTCAVAVTLCFAGCTAPGDRETSAVPAPAATPTVTPSTDCQVVGDDENEWLGSEDNQRVMSVITSVLAARFGEATKADPGSALSKGLIGITSETESRTVVVVVDPDLADVAVLQAELGKAVEADRVLNPATSPPAVRVQPGCNSAKALLDIGAKINARSWSTDAGQATFTSNIDARTSTYEVTFNENSRSAAEALQEQAPKLVAVTYGPSSVRRGTATASPTGVMPGSASMETVWGTSAAPASP